MINKWACSKVIDGRNFYILETKTKYMPEHICVCGAEFDTQWSLEQHLDATGHSSEYIGYPDDDTFTCHGCEREFSSLSAVHQHMQQCDEIEDINP